jgi:hypothetical protein
MSFEIPIFILLGVSIILYLMGHCSPAMVIGQMCEPVENLISSVGIDEPGSLSIINSIKNIFTDPLFLGIAGVTTIIAFVLSGVNFSVTYIIPLFIMVVLIGFFILPISFIFSTDMDPVIKVIVGLFLNTMLVLSIVQFIRG